MRVLTQRALHTARPCSPRSQLVPAAAGVEVATFDLADLGSVRDWAKRAQDVGAPLDVLVNNAGRRDGCRACRAAAAAAVGASCLHGFPAGATNAGAAWVRAVFSLAPRLVA